MRKNSIINVVVHMPENADLSTLRDRINGVHAEMIERRLERSDLTSEEKISVIDKIIDDMKSRENDGIIG